MPTLITYDLRSGTSNHNEVFLAAAQLEDLIFVTRGAIREIIYRLPKSTVWGRFNSVVAANAAFDRALALTSQVVGYQVRVEKRMTVNFSFHGIRSNVSVPVDPDLVGNDDFETALRHQENVERFKLSDALIHQVNLASLSV